MQGGVKRVRSAERALDVLRVFLESAEPMGLAELCHLIDLPKSTAYRSLLTLESSGFLKRLAGTDRYALAPLLLRRSGPATPLLSDAARQVMEDLRDALGETVGLHRLEGDERLCVAAAEGVRPMRTSGRVGSRAPLYSGASARAILAFMPEARKEAIITQTRLVPLTPNTITDPARLRAELAWIRQHGYAVSTGEWDEGITSVAAPVFGSRGAVAGSINISGPVPRFSEEKTRLLAGALKVAAGEISLILQRPASRSANERMDTDAV